MSRPVNRDVIEDAERRMRSMGHDPHAHENGRMPCQRRCGISMYCAFHPDQKPHRMARVG